MHEKNSKPISEPEPLKNFAEDIVETVRDPILVLTSELKIVFANHSFYQTFHTNRENTVGRFLFDLGNRQWDIPALSGLLKKLLKNDTDFKDFEVEHEFRRIGKKVMHINARQLKKEKNYNRYILLAIEDVTERVHMERNLREYKKHLEELVDYRAQTLKKVNKELAAEKERLNVTLRSIGDAVIATDINGNVTLVNHSAETLTGWPQNEALGKPLPKILNIVDQRSRTPIVDLSQRILKSKGILSNETHLNLISKDGQERMIADSGSPIWDAEENVTGTVIVFRDITDEKKMEETLRHSHKIESIGTLAGGIAHDFNNILFAIIGHTDLAMLDQKEGSKSLKYLEGIYKACTRAKDLVHQILTFSRQTEPVFKPVNVNLVTKEAVKLIRASLPSTIDIQLDINSQSKIFADGTQIYQVVYNLCTNAAQAVQDKVGQIQVSLTDFEMDDQVLPLHPYANPGKYVKLAVVDSGHGISSEIKDKIFDPYFTTKQLSKGTGLGLSVVHGIVTAHEGFISVFSDPDKGTIFEVYFPVLERTSKKLRTVKRFEPLPTGTERILLVDDEEQIVQMERRMLEKLGYQVITSTRGKAALDIFAGAPGKFDLVISDMTMPEITGYQLAKKIKAIRQDVPIIICSGYSQYISDKKLEEIGINAFVSKPMTMTDLSNVIRKILDKEIHERRQNERFKIEEKAVAISRSNPAKEFDIVDISWGGLAICSDTSPDLQSFDEFTINLVNKGIIIDKLPCKLVSDVTVLDDPYAGIKRRQGLQFRKLAYNQLNMLDHLIQSYTVANG